MFEKFIGKVVATRGTGSGVNVGRCAAFLCAVGNRKQPERITCLLSRALDQNVAHRLKSDLQSLCACTKSKRLSL